MAYLGLYMHSTSLIFVSKHLQLWHMPPAKGAKIQLKCTINMAYTAYQIFFTLVYTRKKTVRAKKKK